MSERQLRLHGLWFDIRQLDVLYHEAAAQRWCVLDAATAGRILDHLEAV